MARNQRGLKLPLGTRKTVSQEKTNNSLTKGRISSEVSNLNTRHWGGVGMIHLCFKNGVKKRLSSKNRYESLSRQGYLPSLLT